MAGGPSLGWRGVITGSLWPRRALSGRSLMKAFSSVFSPVCVFSSVAVPVARTLPAFMATSQSNRSASSI